MTVQMVVYNRHDRRVASELILVILGHNVIGLSRGPKALRRYLMFHLALEVDEPGEASMKGNVLELVLFSSFVSSP